ncbi:MAG TPA: phosphate ABC transporter substrate-binding protein [Chthoniobacterales bacterium]|jgi:phosphate transport system substrate-binding protein|nr:phosphate ABC transporter substrate-binding protein [Chthoniobacterales bacterium]
MKLTYLITTIALAFVTAEARAEKLVIKGSDTLGAKLVPQLAEQFKAQHPGTTFDIAAEGSTTGIAAIIDGTAQIGMSSRRAKPAEVSAASGKGVNLKPTIVAYDGIGVIVNAANPIKSLTRKQIEQIFTGEVSDWSAVGGSGGKISIYTRNTSSGTYSDFKELAMKKRDYATGSQKMAGNEQIAAEVGRNPNGIGYVGLAYIKASGVKVMPIDGVLPSVQSVHAKTYPYARPTFYYTNGEANGLARQFFDFTLSGAGQKIVSQVGFVPIQ